jgi:hypothetical protein
MSLGDKAAAFAFVEKGMTVLPIEKDPLLGPASIEILARVTAGMGDPTAPSPRYRNCSQYRIQAL